MVKDAHDEHHGDHAVPLAPAMPLLVGMTAGLLTALAVDVELAERGMSIATAWSAFSGGEQVRFASASAIWAVAGAALIAGAIAATLLGKFPPPWHRATLVRWVIGAAILFALAHVAHGVETPHGVSPGAGVLGEASAVVIGAVMALVGAFFARPR